MLETTETRNPTVVTVPVTPVYLEMATGTTLRFTNNPDIYESFEVIFLGDSVPSKSGTRCFAGETEIFIPVDREGEFAYVIGYKRRKDPCGRLDYSGVCLMKGCEGGC
jgi:hypothetical protein